MKGGFNKLLRNIVAGSSDTEYEKVSNSFALTNFDLSIAETNKGNIPSRQQGTQREAYYL